MLEKRSQEVEHLNGMSCSIVIVWVKIGLDSI